MLRGTIDFYHPDLILVEGHMVSAKQNLLALFSSTLSSWPRWNLIWCWSNSSWTSWYYFWVRFCETREVAAVLLPVSKKFMLVCIRTFMNWTAFRHLWINLVQRQYDGRYYWILHFDTSLTDLDLDWRAQECKEAKTSAAIISQSFLLIMLEFGILLRLVGVMNLIYHFISTFEYSRERILLMWFCWKKNPFNTGLYSDIFRVSSFSLDMMIAGMKTSPPFSTVPLSSYKISSVGKNSPPKKGRGKKIMERFWFSAESNLIPKRADLYSVG